MIPILRYPAGATPGDWGRLHGETHAQAIAEIAQIRLDLTVRLGGFASADAVLGLAEAHLPVLQGFSPALHAELLGISEGARVSPADLIVLNHYTDLRDLGPACRAAACEDDCTAVVTPSPEGPLLGQTWDMHASAMPYVLMLRVPASEGRAPAWLLSITGCLGMAGLNAQGVGLTINNLKSRDARVGILWPALVRRALQEPTAAAARAVIERAPIGSGHHYLVADPSAAFAIETSGRARSLVHGGDHGPYLHTNHCLDEGVAARSWVDPSSTTWARYDALRESLEAAPVQGLSDLWTRLGSHEGYPRSVCTHMATDEAPHAMATCAGLVLDLARREVACAQGCLHHARPSLLGFDDERSP